MNDQHYRLTFDLLPIGASVVGPDGTILRVNDAFCALTGYARNELAGRTYSDLNGLKKLASAIDELAEADDVNRENNSVERRLVRRDGRAIRVLVSMGPVSDEKGRSAHHLLLVQDITGASSHTPANSFRLPHSALHNPEVPSLLTWAERSMDVIYRYRVAEPRGYDYISSAITAMTGYTPEECYADPSLGSRMVHPDDRHLLDSIVQRTLPGGSTLTARWIHKNGTVIWVERRNVPIYDDMGNLVAIEGIARDITQQKEYEDRLRLQAHLLDIVHNAVIATDATGKITYWNRHAEVMLGWSACEVVGSRIEDIGLSPYTEEQNKEIVERLSRGESWSDEVESRRRDGTTFPTYFTTSPIRDEQGNYIGTVGIATDVTERKRAEEELRASKARFELLGKTSRDWLWEYDFLEDKGWCNEPGRIAFGLASANDITPDMWRVRVHPDDREKILAAADEAQRTGKTSWEYEYRIQIADGSYRSMLDRGSFILDNSGRPLKAVGAMVDITELKRAEEELRLSSERLERITRASQDWLWEYDILENKSWWNQPRREALGLADDEEPSPEIWMSRIHPDDLERVRAEIDELDRSGAAGWASEYRIRVADGSYRTVLDRGSNIYDSAGRKIKSLGALTNITELKRAEEALQEREALLRAVIDTFPFPIWGRDKEGRINLQNAMSKRWWKDHHGKSIEQSSSDPDLVATWKEQYERTLAGEVVRAESQQVVQGEVRYLDEVIAPISRGDEIIGSVGVQFDITERRRAEEELRNSEARFRAVNESLIQHVEELSALNIISQIVSTVAYIPSALQIVAKMMANLFNASDVVVSLLDREKESLTVLTQVRRLSEGQTMVVSAAEGRSIPLDEHPAARLAIANEETIQLRNEDEGNVRQREAIQGDGLELDEGAAGTSHVILSSGAVGDRLTCMLAAPLRARGKVVGLLTISSDEEGRSFSTSELALAQTIAGSVAVAVETSKLLTQEQQQRMVAESLRDVLGALAGSLDRETVIRTIFEQLRRVIRYDGAAIYLRKRDKLVIGQTTGFANRYNDFRLPLSKDGPPQQIIKTKQPLAIADAVGYPNWHLPDSAGHIRSWMGAPLAIGSKVIGVLAVCYSVPNAYTSEDLEVMQLFAQHAGTALQNSQRYEQAQSIATDEERNRLARELHDSVTQALFSANLIADVLPQLSEQDPAKAADGLQTLRRLTKGALAEMRSLLLELRPLDLHSTRLDIAIGHLATATTLQAPMKVETSLDPIPPLPPRVQVALYRIVQEAFNNIVKHARAHNVELVARVTPSFNANGKGGDGNTWRGKVSIEIRDDGAGFDPAQTEEGHLGLSIMRERAKSVRATLLISSAPGHGSKVTAIWEGATALKERSTL